MEKKARLGLRELHGLAVRDKMKNFDRFAAFAFLVLALANGTPVDAGTAENRSANHTVYAVIGDVPSTTRLHSADLGRRPRACSASGVGSRASPAGRLPARRSSFW